MNAMSELTNYQELQRLVLLDTQACIPWTRGGSARGYGYLRVFGKMRKAHRTAFELTHGYLPPVVRHTCDNPCCVNPKHLLPGTQADNVRDICERKRWNDRGGMANGRCVLSDADVVQIRALYVKGSKRNHEGNAFALADRFGVSRSQIQRIVAQTQR